ncbi:MAG: GyrI-like domain-containing protein [Bacteroidales bacterium]|nr:GyrI-like domain-containing protein [Bacteroidales bacterium]
MTPEIIEIKPKKLIGMRIQTTFADDKTVELWKKFMPRLNEIVDSMDTTLYSIKNYEAYFWYLEDKMDRPFEKWTTMEVKSFDNIPEGMETYEFKGGKYAVFVHKGPVSTYFDTIRYIFEEWVPNSGYQIDNREHFEVLDEKYKPYSEDSEETIWLPITEELE